MEQSPSREADGHSTEQEFLALYITRRFIIAFSGARHWYLYRASWIRSTTSHPISLKYIYIIPSHLRLGVTSFLFDDKFDRNPPKQRVDAFCVNGQQVIKKTCFVFQYSGDEAGFVTSTMASIGIEHRKVIRI